jgi:hypothetical protein
MSKKLLYILLLISLAFNLAFVGSFIYLKALRPRPPRDFRDTRRPDFDKHRWQPIMESDSTRAFRDAFLASKKQLMEELAKESIDETAINAIIQSSLQAQAALETDLGKRLIALRKTMTPAEAKEHFTDRIKQMNERKDRRIDKLKRRHDR